MSAPFPRLLIATEFPPNASGGGAAIVRQMLRDWPADKLFWWSYQPDHNRYFGREVAAHHVATIPPKLIPVRRWTHPKSWLLENFWTPWAAGHFEKTLRELKPDVVWVIPHCWAIPPLAKILPAAKIGFHVSVHDFPDCDFWVRSFGANRCRRLLALTGKLYAAASTRDAIGQRMVDDLRQQTGCEGMVIRAGLESEDFARLQTPASGSRKAVRIAHAGTIHVDATFALFAAAFQKIRRQLPRPVTLEFFGNHSYRTAAWFDASWMKEHGNLPVPELNAALRECDWGFLPMALADVDPRYNHFSLPTGASFKVHCSVNHYFF